MGVLDETGNNIAEALIALAMDPRLVQVIQKYANPNVMAGLGQA
jgi:hypothetical protein